ncbi:uncharacterized protein BJ212DRAFT_1483252 [Suillus subaureus]|uniref:Uncharacterized protein n=1 Tax=Suillus subaureus TaxID=48587 RepID=A0A9P7JAZ6_9AGAM|nr:uncharacterized protein BJ212DRAFT_1483252 [Suillus subaureus]KAG1812061.1 hypothetical protein BJ212DRAFT_1483252 [Suillus subaureus]
MSTCHITCTKNATQHPGLVDMVLKKKHHTAAEVAAERQAKLDAKEEKEHAKGARIKCCSLTKIKALSKAYSKKTYAKPSPPPEDDRFISDVKMEDAISSTFDPDPS